MAVGTALPSGCYLSVANPPSRNAISGLTVFGWFYVPTRASGEYYSTLLLHYPGNLNIGEGFQFEDGGTDLNAFIMCYPDAYESLGGTYATGTWYFQADTYTNVSGTVTRRTYIGTVAGNEPTLIAEKTWTVSQNPDSPDYFDIGEARGWNRTLRGSIEYVGLAETAMSPEQLATQSGSSSATVPCWVFISGENGTYVDSSGNNRTIIVTGGTPTVSDVGVSLGDQNGLSPAERTRSVSAISAASSSSGASQPATRARGVGSPVVTVGAPPTVVAASAICATKRVGGFAVTATETPVSDRQVGLVANYSANSLTPVAFSGSAWTPGTAISLPSTGPFDVKITSDGLRALTANASGNSATPLTWNDPSWTPGTAVACGSGPRAVAIAPDGIHALVANYGSNDCTPLKYDGVSWTAGTAIPCGSGPRWVEIAPDGIHALVCNSGTNTVTPLTRSGDTWTAGTAITVGTSPRGAAFSPDSSRALVANSSSSSVTPLTRSGDTWTPGTAVTTGGGPRCIAITSDGLHALVANYDGGNITQLTWSGGAWVSEGELSQAGSPFGVGILADDVHALVSLSGSNTVVPLTRSGNTWSLGSTVTVGSGPYGLDVITISSAKTARPGSACLTRFLGIGSSTSNSMASASSSRIARALGHAVTNVGSFATSVQVATVRSRSTPSIASTSSSAASLGAVIRHWRAASASVLFPRCIGYGHSVIAGYGVPDPSLHTPEQLKLLLGDRIDTSVKLGYSGESAATLDANFEARVGPYVEAGRPTIVYVTCMFNSAHAGVPAAEIMASYWSICAKARALGCKVIMLCESKADLDSQAHEEILVECNNIIRAQWRDHADGYVNVREVFWNPTDTTLYQDDGAHFTALGLQKLAQLVYIEVDRLLREAAYVSAMVQYMQRRRTIGAFETGTYGTWWSTSRDRVALPPAAGTAVIVTHATVSVSRARACGFASLAVIASSAAANGKRSTTAWSAELNASVAPRTVSRSALAPAVSSVLLVSAPQISAMRLRSLGVHSISLAVTEASLSKLGSSGMPGTFVDVSLVPVRIDHGIGPVQTEALSTANGTISSMVRARATGELAVEMASLASVSSAVRFAHVSNPGTRSAYFGPFTGVAVIGNLYSGTARIR